MSAGASWRCQAQGESPLAPSPKGGGCGGRGQASSVANAAIRVALREQLPRLPPPSGAPDPPHTLYKSAAFGCQGRPGLRRRDGGAREMHSSGRPTRCPRLLKVCWWRGVCVLYPVLCLATLHSGAEAVKVRCGRELVADLEFVCGERGFYRGKVASSRNGARLRGKGIVEQCCLRGCDLLDLEAYCAKPRHTRRSAPATDDEYRAPLRKRAPALDVLLPPKTPTRDGPRAPSATWRRAARGR
ncbi:insulin-like growth factor I [Arapaima gigas]